MKGIFYILLVILTLQLSFDETLSHFDPEGNIDLNGNSTFASINFHLQKCHDHFWVVSDISDLICCQDQISSSPNIPEQLILPDFDFIIWQPPKILRH
ncbi:MAG: hypothetical protein V1775_01135 [Bacteroidota bacterium]